MADQQDNSIQNQPNSLALLQSILPNLTQGQQANMGGQNPITNLTDSQAEALNGVIKQQDKKHAQEAIMLHPIDQLRQLVNLHQQTSSIFSGGGNPSGGASGSRENSNNIQSKSNTSSNSANISPSKDMSNNDSNTDNKSSQILDPLIQAARANQTTLPSKEIGTPASPANVQRGNFEQDAPKNIFEKIFGMPQAYQDAQGITHYKPGGFLQAGRNQDYLDQAKSMQELSGTKAVQPEQSIAFGLEAAKQNAEKVPMTQAQKAEYNLQVQNQAMGVAKDQVEQFNQQSTPVISSLQKLDQLLPLGQAAINGDRVAQGSLLAGAKELYGTAGNILGQSAVGKLATLIGGKFDKNQMKSLVTNMQQVRQAMIKKLAATEKSSASRIGNLKIGDKSIYASDLLSHPYSQETSPLVNNFKSMDEANKSSVNLKDGALVTIDGKQYKWSAQ